MLNRRSFYNVLEGVIRTYGTQQKAAKALGVSGAYLCDVRHGRREPGKKLLTGLGYRRVVMFERILARGEN